MNSRLGTSCGHLLRHKSRGGTWCLSPELSPAGSGYLFNDNSYSRPQKSWGEHPPLWCAKGVKRFEVSCDEC